MLDFASWPLKKPTIENISAINMTTTIDRRLVSLTGYSHPSICSDCSQLRHPARSNY